MVNRPTIGLKGQLILALSKRSVALGWKMSVKIVRAITFFKEQFSFRTDCKPPSNFHLVQKAHQRKQGKDLRIGNSLVLFLNGGDFQTTKKKTGLGIEGLGKLWGKRQV